MHKKRGYDSLHKLEINGVVHYIYAEEGKIHGYGMGAYADSFSYYEISEKDYDEQILPDNAKFICSLGIKELNDMKVVTDILQSQYEITYFHKFYCEVHEHNIKRGLYCLVPLSGTWDDLEKDKSFALSTGKDLPSSSIQNLTEYHEWKAVVRKIICPKCGYVKYFDDTAIPLGEKYEFTCPECGMLIMRKKD